MDIVAHGAMILLLIAMVFIAFVLFYQLILRPLLMRDWPELFFGLSALAAVIGLRWFIEWYSDTYG